MADRSARLLADCIIAARARRMRAEGAHAAAVRKEKEAVVAAEAAAAAVTRAADDWMHHVGEGFDPTLGTLLGRQLLMHVGASDTTAQARRIARAACERTADDWRSENVRRRALEDEAAATIRRATRRADERMLAVLADRETLARSGRRR